MGGVAEEIFVETSSFQFRESCPSGFQDLLITLVHSYGPPLVIMHGTALESPTAPPHEHHSSVLDEITMT